MVPFTRFQATLLLFLSSHLFLVIWTRQQHHTRHQARTPSYLQQTVLLDQNNPDHQHPPGLRILCVGDSITKGSGDGLGFYNNNGYRLDLYNLLKADGINAQFIGSQTDGTDNPQPNPEGFGGAMIDEVMHFMEKDNILSEQPSLVLVHAGTNDNDMEDEIRTFASVPQRYASLIDYITTNAPDAVLLVAQLIQNNWNQSQTTYFNAHVPAIVDERLQQGHKIRLVDMSMIGGSELDNVVHPNKEGYAHMASLWYSTIMSVPESWWAESNISDGSSQ